MMSSAESQAERSVVQFGLTRIAYAIQRSRRRATVSIAVDPEHGVLVTAPTVTSVGRLDRVVRQKAAWITGRLRNRRALEEPTPREFVSGETFKYLGRGYRLKVVARAVVRADVALRGSWFLVTVPRTLEGAARAASVRDALAAWYRNRATERLPDFVAGWMKRLRVTPERVLVREQPKRWGSCDAKGHLRLNWRIAQAARALVDYVVVHELLHLRHEHHTSAFWAELGKVMPDYESRRDQLKRIGPGLVW